MPTLDRNTTGVYAIAPTPFDEEGGIDFASIDRMTDFYASAGIDGLTVLGQLGEATKLTHDEAVSVATRIIGRIDVPVVVGVSAPGFAAMNALSEDVMAAGAAAVMVAPPNTLRTDDEITSYYSGVAAAVGTCVPLVIQDFPLTFSVKMSPAVIARIVQDNPSCVMLKHEDWPGLEKITALRALEAAGEMPRIAILCGNGGLFLDFEMERGADGAMTGYCFPELLVDVVRMSAAGERASAHHLFDAHLPLIRYEQQPGAGLAVRKYVLMRRGLLGTDTQRAPLTRLSSTARAEIDYLLGRLAQHDARAAV